TVWIRNQLFRIWARQNAAPHAPVADTVQKLNQLDGHGTICGENAACPWLSDTIATANPDGHGTIWVNRTGATMPWQYSIITAAEPVSKWTWNYLGRQRRLTMSPDAITATEPVGWTWDTYLGRQTPPCAPCQYSH
ncbi:hypothetical protein AVEN_194127-1, partial [Araneus ventricosus]